MIRRALAYLILASGAVLAAFPFVWMLGTSLKAPSAAVQPTLAIIPDEFHWTNFIEAFNAAPFAIYLFNSLVVAAATSLAVVITALAAGYAFARLPFRGRGILFALLIATMMIPFEMMLIPNFITINRLGWFDTYAALIVPWMANAFSIFLMRQAFLGLPQDYFDAATIDGCGHLRFLVWIGAPLVRPMVATVALLAFITSYNAVLWPLVVTTSTEMRVAQVGLTVFASEAGIQFHLLMCAAAVVMLPTVALYFAAQRNFEESAIGAGIKT